MAQVFLYPGHFGFQFPGVFIAGGIAHAFQEVVVRAFGMFGPPFGVAFILPCLVISNTFGLGTELFAFISFDIKTEQVVVAEAAFFAFEVAGFLHALGHHKVGVLDTGCFDRIVNRLQAGHIHTLAVGRAYRQQE